MNRTHDKVIDAYRRLYAVHGYSPRALGWDKGKQFLRFHQLTSDWDLTGASILDVGCGFGDFVDYLRFMNIQNYTYTGIDLLGEFIAEGKKRYSSPQATFLQAAFEDYDSPSTFDYVIASGVFNLKVEGIDAYEQILRSMTKMFGLSQVALSVDFISSKVDYAHQHNFNSSPETILSMAYGLSRNVILKNNYFPFEFAVTIYRDDSYRKETTIFSTVEAKLASLNVLPGNVNR
jgi:SAM-dependent methyltransferase